MHTQPPSSEKVEAAEGDENFASLISFQASHTLHKYFVVYIVQAKRLIRREMATIRSCGVLSVVVV